MRGYRLGYKSSDTVTALVALMINPTLQKSLESEKKKLTTRLKGTGVVSLRNRITFANKNWVKFAKLKTKLPEGMFSVNYFRFTNIRFKRVAEQRAKPLEDELITEYRPVGNMAHKELWGTISACISQFGAHACAQPYFPNPLGSIHTLIQLGQTITRQGNTNAGPETITTEYSPLHY